MQSQAHHEMETEATVQEEIPCSTELQSETIPPTDNQTNISEETDSSPKSRPELHRQIDSKATASEETYSSSESEMDTHQPTNSQTIDFCSQANVTGESKSSPTDSPATVSEENDSSPELETEPHLTTRTQVNSSEDDDSDESDQIQQMTTSSQTDIGNRIPNFLSAEETNFLRFCHLVQKIAPQAVRCRFDQEFPPPDLDGIIRKHLTTLKNLKQKKVITSTQWKLLLPYGSTAVSADFDVTLMICLFRHLSSISPQSGDYDNLPPPSDESLGADLARVKYYRNNISHCLERDRNLDNFDFPIVWGSLSKSGDYDNLPPPSDESLGADLARVKFYRNNILHCLQRDRNLDNFDFPIVWESLSKAIGRIGGHTYEQECANLLVTNLDPSYMDIYKEFLMTEAALKEKMQDIENTLKDPVPRNERVNMDLMIQQWKANDKLFVDTNGYKALIKSLKTESVAILTGTPGCGKSCTAQHALLSLCTAGYDIIPVTSSTDMVRYFSRQTRQVFYIDNVFGKYNISSYDIDEWERNKNRISDIFTSTLTKCIFTCRLQILKDPHFVNLKLAKVKIFDLSGSHKLTLREKISIGTKYLQEDILKCLSDETITKSECFPLLCSLYGQHSHESTLFFEKPKTYFETELDELKNKPDKLKYACIALCVMFNGKVPYDIFTQSADVTASNRLNATLHECEVNTSTPKKTILSQFEAMVGTYFQKSEMGYKSIHDYMFDVYCSHVISTSMLQCIVENADSRLLCDRALLESLAEDSHQFTIVIPATLEVNFFKRIVEDIKNSKIWDVFSSRQLKFARYREKLISFLQRNKEIINNTDEDGGTALYVSSRNGCSDIVDLLCNIGGNVNQCNKNGLTPLFVASQKGYSDIVNMLYNKGGNVNQCDKDGYTPLYGASHSGHSDIVYMLCNRGGNVNQCTKDGRTPLFTASFQGNETCVDVLLNRGAEINKSNKIGSSPLYVASQEGHSDIVHILFKRGGNVNQCTTDGRTPLYIASYNRNKTCVDVLIKRGAEVNTCNTKGFTPLHIASQEGHSDIVDMLCNRGGNVNQCDKDGLTPLYVASQEGHSGIVDMLCNRGGCVNKGDKNGRTPLYIASQVGHSGIVDMLCNRGGNINQCDKDGRTPLYIASQVGHSDIGDMLCKREGNVNMCDKDGRTPLYTASFEGHNICVDLLLNRGAEVNTCNTQGFTPLHVASQEGHSDIVDMLCNSGGNVNQRTKDGRTPLYIASYKGNITCVYVLLNGGAEVNTCNNNGASPLYVASQEGHSDIVDMLHTRGGNANQCDRDGRM